MTSRNRYEEQPRQGGRFVPSGEPLSKKTYGVRLPVAIANFLEGLDSKDRSALMKGAIIREALSRMDDGDL